MRRALVLMVGFPVLAATTVAHGSEVPFGNALPFAAQDGAAAVAVADLDRDGWMDVAMALIEGDAVVVRFGGDSPTYLTLASGFDRACDVLVADVDGDGWLDVVGAKRGTGDDGVRWWENPGDSGGGWSEHSVSGVYFDEARGVDAGDLDRDGDLDVVAGAYLSGAVSWFLNDGGDGTAWVAHDVPFPLAGVYSVQAVDMDSDGRLDLVTGTRNDSAEADIVVWRQGASGWTPVAVDTDFDGATTLRLVDVNRDGALDILSYAIYSERIAWFENAGPTTYLEHPIASGQGNHLDAADLDCDGDLDVVAVAFYTDHLTWWENTAGDGSVWVERAIPTPRVFQSVRAGDVDQDGDSDLVAGHAGSPGSLWVLTNDLCAGGGFTANELGDMYMNDVELGDFNLDGSTDLAVVSFPNNTVAVWLSTGAPGVFERHDVTTTHDGGQDLVAADLDLDGDLDLASAAYYLGELRWWANDGSGTSWTETLIADSLDHPAATAVGDVDSDGDQDLAVVEWGVDRISVYLNYGGQYRVQPSDHAPAYLPDSSAAAVIRFSVTTAGRAGDPDIEFRLVWLVLVDGTGAYVSQAQAEAIFAGVQVWHDANGSGFFESWEDLMLVDAPPSMPGLPGFLVLGVPAGGGNPPIAGHAGSETYFAVFETTADATAHLPDAFQVRHQWTSWMTSYVEFPACSLRSEFWEAVTSRTVTLGEDPSLLFADDFEAGSTGAWSNTVP